MSAWRRKAIECIPELKREFEDSETTIYGVFQEVLPLVVDAHRAKDFALLERCYVFAEWCIAQRAEDLWNAAGVSFYEHLADYPETRAAMPQWVKLHVYTDVRALLQARLSPEQFKELDSHYKRRER